MSPADSHVLNENLLRELLDSLAGTHSSIILHRALKSISGIALKDFR
uniref:Uncharacterized protein n=1 Tax=Pseudomonas fluorescens (strain SBW25) TaxID=216595 RepID=A0A0G4E3Y5_PSEFS|nr:hypothetical protein PQBR57_0013 [Pseudomonas fluorescens SBW25]